MTKIIKPFFSHLALLCLMGWAILGCSKEFSLEGVGKSSGEVTGTWEFTEGTNYFSGLIDSSFIKEGPVIKELHIIGYPHSGEETFHLVLYSDSFNVGSYPASAFRSSMDYGTPLSDLYTADQTVGEFIVKITGINKNVIIGTFSGKALKEGAASVEITKGAFKVVLPDIPSGPPSEGVMGNMTGNCLPIKINGVYRQNTTMDATNTVQVEVTVNKTGSYHIYTDPVNGITFSASGNFNSRGTQQVTLKASGTPAFGGDQEFIVHYGNSACGFNINFEEATATSNDYFPTSKNTWWGYDNEGSPLFLKVLPGTLSHGGNSFTVIGAFEKFDDTNFDTAIIIRKNNGSYFDLINEGILSNPDGKRIETIFLKDNVSKGSGWDGPQMQEVVNGVQLNVHFKFTIIDKQVSASVGPFNFPDVIKVKAELYSGTTPVGFSMEQWFARNVGLIYQKDFYGDEMRIQEYIVY